MHVVQDERPGSDAKVPKLQRRQALELLAPTVALYVPLEQFRHVPLDTLPTTVEYVPAGQATHAVGVTYVPAAQAMQVALDVIPRPVL